MKLSKYYSIYIYRKNLKKLKKNFKNLRKPSGFALPKEIKKWILGILMFLMAIIITLSFFDLAGVAGKAILKGFIFLIGKAVFALPLILILGGLTFFYTRYKRFLPAFFLCLAEFTVLHGADWPQLQCDAARSGFQPGERLATNRHTNTNPAGYGAPVWSWNAPAKLAGQPVAASGIVAVATTQGQVYALDERLGSVRWTADAGAPVFATLAIASGRVIVPTQRGELLALDAATGTPRWRVRAGGPTRGAPAVAGGRVFVVTLENRLVALSAEDGRQLWVHRAAPAAAIPFGLATPAVEGDIVVAGFASGELVALRAPEGRLLWTETVAGASRGTIADIGGIRAAPAIREGIVFVAGLSGLSIAVDLRSGRRLWEREASSGSTPAVAGDWAFLVAEPARVLCVERQTGRVRWVADAAEGGRGAVRAAPLLAGGRLIVPGTDSRALLLDPADGSATGALRLPGPVLQPMAVAAGRLIVLTQDGTLAAYAGQA